MKPKKSIKPFLWSLLGVAILLIVALGLFPAFSSTSFGKQWLVNRINNRISGHLSIDQMSLSWWRGQHLEGVSLKDRSGEEILSFHSFSTENSLFSLLLNSRSLGNTTVFAPYLRLIENKEGELNLSEALSSKKKHKKTKKKKSRAFPKFKGDLLILDGELYLATPKIEPAMLSDFNVELKKNPDLFQVSGKTKQGSIEGQILANGTFHENLFLLINIDQFPLAILDQFWETPLFTEGLGKTLTLDMELSKTNQQIFLSSTVQTALLKGSFNGTTKEGKFVLDSGSANWTMTPAFFKQAIESSATEDWRLASKTDLHLDIQRLEFPLELKKIQWNKILFSGKAAIDRAEIVHTELGPFSLNRFIADLNSADTLQVHYLGNIQGKAGTTQMEGQIELDSEGKAVFNSDWKGFPVDLFQLAADETVYLRTIVGPTFDFTTSGTYDHKHLKAYVTMESSRATLAGNIESQDMQRVDMDLSGEMFYSQRYSSIFGPSPFLRIQAETSLLNHTFTIPSIHATLHNPYWTLDVNGKLGEKGEHFNFDEVQLVCVGSITKELPSAEHHTLIHSGDLFIQVEGRVNVIHAKIDLVTSFDGHPERRSLQATGEVKNFVQGGKLAFNQSEILIDGNLASFPVAILNPFVNEKVDLISLFGSSVDVQFQGAYTPKGVHKETLDLQVSGQDFHGILSVALDGSLTVSQEKPAFMHWELTPARYQFLMRLLKPDQEPAYVLTRGASVDLTITEFLCPTTSPSKITSFLCQSGFIGEIKVGPLHFKSRKGTGEVALLETVASIEGENFSKTIQIFGKGKIVSPSIPAGEHSGFAFAGELMGFWNPDGAFNRQGTFKGDLSLDLLPVREFTGILPLNEERRQQVQALLGPLVNARIFGEISELSGPLTVDIKSSNLKVILPIQLGGGYITLQKTVEAELTLTESVNEIFLKDAIPLLITGAWSDHPVRVFLDAEGFSVRFQPFSLRGINIAHGVIDIGKVTVHNGGNIQSLVQFLKAKEITDEGIMSAWFTPIFFSLQDGIARYKRFDALLAGNIHIAMWGKIDLNKDRVSMVLGIGPSTLKQRFKIVGLNKRDVFQLKMRGSTSNVDIDWSSAYTRIGILITRSAGHLGNLLGGIIEQFIGDLGEEETPPPTTSPFPWEKSNSQPSTGMPRESPAPPSKRSRNRFINFLSSLLRPPLYYLKETADK